MNSAQQTFIDPVCEMKVTPETAAAVVERDGKKFYFCSTHCRDEFVRQRQHGQTQEHERQSATKRTYTCPMHPHIEQDHPGSCPICGMALEAKNVVAGDEEENVELRDMTRRFWIGAALSLPVFLLAMSHLLPSAPHWMESDFSRWV